MALRRSLSHLSDVELVRQAQEGHQAALAALIERYHRFARAKSRGYFLVGGDGDDLEQEALIGLCNAARDYRSDQACSFRSFLELCVTRQIMTAIKAANRRKHQPLNRSVAIASGGPEPDGTEVVSEERLVDERTLGPADCVVSSESAADMRKTLCEVLSDFELAVLELYANGRSYGEIGDALDRETKAIDNALQRIKRKMEGPLANHLAGVASSRTRPTGGRTERPSATPETKASAG